MLALKRLPSVSPQPEDFHSESTARPAVRQKAAPRWKVELRRVLARLLVLPMLAAVRA